MPLATRAGMAIVAMALLMHADTTLAEDGSMNTFDSWNSQFISNIDWGSFWDTFLSYAPATPPPTPKPTPAPYRPQITYSPNGPDGFSAYGWPLTSGEEHRGASGNGAGVRPVVAGSASGNCNNDGKDSASEILRTVFEGIIALAAVYIAWNWKDHTNNGHGTGLPRQYASQAPTSYTDSIRNAGTQGSVSEL